MTTTYDFDGHLQTITVGTSGTYHITVNGASGGHGGTGFFGGGKTRGAGAIVSSWRDFPTRQGPASAASSERAAMKTLSSRRRVSRPLVSPSTKRN